jgi:hypothetical protein
MPSAQAASDATFHGAERTDCLARIAQYSVRNKKSPIMDSVRCVM